MQNRYYSLIILFFIIILLAGCSSEKDAQTGLLHDVAENVYNNQLHGVDLIDYESVYEQDRPISIKYLYLTVPKANNIAKGKIVRLQDLLDYRWQENAKSLKLEVVFQEGSADGPELGYMGYGRNKINASMAVRGRSSTSRKQKSFKIDLYESAGLWNNHSVVNLNKHPKDLTRVRNKLCFDYFTLIPNFTSLRTQFVNLYVKDLSSGNQDFVDYGLYTQIEHPNKSFLKNHGLDPSGHLYKAEYFEFYRYKDRLKLADDPEYNEKEFEQILEVKGSKDHRKLLRMLDDLNDYSLNINQIVEEHFNRDNLLTWVAVNILMGNIDTSSNNFFLYSPLNSETWYFLPWDYDVSFGIHQQLGSRHEEHPDWKYGLSNYWGMVMFNRFFRDHDNLTALNDKIEELSNIINREQTKEFLDTYHDIAKEHVSKVPDLSELPSPIEYYEAEYQRILDEPEKNRKNYYQSLEKPMPFFLGETILADDKITFTWSPSFDMQADDLAYDFEISTDLDFATILIREEGIPGTEFTTDKMTEGIYYWRVKAHDTKGNSQIAFDVFTDNEDWRFGIKRLMVEN